MTNKHDYVEHDQIETEQVWLAVERIIKNLDGLSYPKRIRVCTQVTHALIDENEAGADIAKFGRDKVCYAVWADIMGCPLEVSLSALAIVTARCVYGIVHLETVLVRNPVHDI